MAAIQKINHLRVVRLVVNGQPVAPIEGPADLPDKPTIVELADAYEDLVGRLTASGLFIAPQRPEKA